MFVAIRKYFDVHPLRTALIAAIVLRLLAAVFSRGYGMHDDHFLVIEVAQSWADGHDYNDWLPQNMEKPVPGGHSLFYAGIHYGIFCTMNTLGIHDPQTKMLIIRLLHAFYSLLIVLLAFKIMFALTQDKRKAGYTALVVAFLWFLPMMSVRNLFEMVCIPPVMAASWYLVRYKNDTRWKFLLLAALFAGISVGLRYQVVFFVFGMGLCLLIDKKWLASVLFGAGSFFVFFLTQFGDLIIWGAPFAEAKEYAIYNMNNSTTYFNAGWELYFLFLGGTLIPPLSVLFFYGYFSNAKKQLILFLPSFIFLFFHTYFPNKQERFILPFVPYLVILGMLGFYQLAESRSRFVLKLRKFAWVFFWVMNSILLLPVTVTYSKRSRVESMYYLGKQADFRNLVIENSNRDDYLMPPLFYLGNWIHYGYFISTTTPDFFTRWMQSVPVAQKPNYVVFAQEENMDERVARFRKMIPDIKLQQVIEPSFMDQVLHYLNPVNKNERWYIYKINTLPDTMYREGENRP